MPPSRRFALDVRNTHQSSRTAWPKLHSWRANNADQAKQFRDLAANCSLGFLSGIRPNQRSNPLPPHGAPPAAPWPPSGRGGPPQPSSCTMIRLRWSRPDRTGPSWPPWLTPHRAPRPDRGFHPCFEAGRRASGASCAWRASRDCLSSAPSRPDAATRAAPI
jgi:hypothetical protein